MEKESRTMKRIATVRDATGWDERTTRLAMRKAAAMGVTNSQYVANKAWDFSDEELLELKEILDLREAQRKESLDWHAKVVCEKSGWTYEDTLELMKAAKQKGYSYQNFIKKALWRKTREEILNLPPYEKKLSARQAQDLEKKQATARIYKEKIKEEMGWTDAQFRLNVFRARIVTGCNDHEYYLFKIYKIGVEEGDKFITARYNARMKTRYCDYGGKTHQFFENKGIFNKDFSQFVRRKWFLSHETSYEKFKKTVADLDKIIAKPLNGIEGIGIRIYELLHTEASYREIFDDIIAGPPSIVEQFITQHPAINEIYPNAVNTIRVMSFLDNGEGKILNAVMKFATTSNVDNYYQGGLAAGVDSETGVLCTEGVDYAGNLYQYHPYSGKEIKGFQIPHWDKVVELIRVAAAIHPELPYIGWDISITPDGPEIVEGNHNQGAYLCQYPFALYFNQGRRFTIDPYLWFE